MKLKDVDSKRQNFIISVVLLLIPMIALACRFDYYYDLNDDVLMKEILSGNYTGVPEGHNIQMLWLISAAISLLYRIVRIAPWYGIFLCACQFGALLLLLNRSFLLRRSGIPGIYLFRRCYMGFLSFRTLFNSSIKVFTSLNSRYTEANLT